MLFDPTPLTVKAAESKLDECTIEELEKIQALERAGKNRVTLLCSIEEWISDLSEQAESLPSATTESVQEKETPADPAPAIPCPGPPTGRLSRTQAAAHRAAKD